MSLSSSARVWLSSWFPPTVQVLALPLSIRTLSVPWMMDRLFLCQLVQHVTPTAVPLVPTVPHNVVITGMSKSWIKITATK